MRIDERDLVSGMDGDYQPEPLSTISTDDDDGGDDAALGDA